MNSLQDMAENVMAHFVAEIRDDFVGSFLRDGGVPDYDALGGAETADVGVGGNGFVAGHHPEHALGRNFLAGAAGDVLEPGNELRGLARERLEFVEHRLDGVRRNENDEQKNGKRDEPEIKPPATQALADDGIENPN